MINRIGEIDPEVCICKYGCIPQLEKIARLQVYNDNLKKVNGELQDQIKKIIEEDFVIKWVAIALGVMALLVGLGVFIQ